jgi:hypothetical protein
MQIQIRGRVIATVGEADRQAPIEARGRLVFWERPISSADFKSVRLYRDTHLDVSIGNNVNTNRLDPQDRFVLVQEITGPAELPQIELVSIDQPFMQNEIELIETYGDPLTIGRGLCDEPVAPSQTWLAPDAWIARVLMLDELSTNDVQLHLESVTEDIATIRATGDVSGIADAAETTISLTGTIEFDISRGVATRCRISVSEKRQPSQLAPGFDAIVKVDATTRSRTECDELTDAALRRRNITPDLAVDAALVVRPLDESFELTHPREWRVVSRRKDGVLLRLLAGSEVIAQCDIATFPRRPAGQQGDLSTYQSGVLKALAEVQPQIVAAAPLTTGSGLSAMRVEASGQQDGVPLRYHYYMLQDATGRRVQLTFVMDQTAANLFGQSDQDLVEGIELVGEVAESRPDGSPPAAEAATTTEQSARAPAPSKPR